MKEFIRQFYNEGFATTFIKKPENYFKKHIKNKKIVNFLMILIKIFYTLLILAFAVFMFKKQFPL
jgi:ABC-type transport system involved in multi-copper enzyme maturation permease subunit